MEGMKDTRRQVKRILVLATSALLIVAAQLIPSHEPDSPLRVAVGLWPGSESLLEAQERGILPESRFVFLEATWPSAVYRALDNNAVDVAVLSTEDLGRLRASGDDVKGICFMDESIGADALLAGEGIDRIDGLSGKRVGVSAHGPGLRFLEAALAGAGLSMQDVEIVTLLEPDIPDSFGAGSVSAVVASEPWLQGTLSGGGRVLMHSGQLETTFYRLLVARTSAIEKHRGRLTELLRAHFELAPAMGTGVDPEGQAGLPNRQRVSPESFAGIMSRIRIFSPEDNVRLMSPDRAEASGPGADGIPREWLDDGIIGEMSR
jgi:NitT/TauT family transport system substrate-binding protein